MTLPFISRSSHAAIVEAKEAQIRVLEGHIHYLKHLAEHELKAREATEKKVLDLVKQSMTPPPTAPATGRRAPARVEPEDMRAPETLDLTQVDPSDNDALWLIAKREIPAVTAITATAALRAVQRVKEQVIEAHAAREALASKPAFVPASVMARISQAEQAGIEAAKVGA